MTSSKFNVQNSEQATMVTKEHNGHKKICNFHPLIIPKYLLLSLCELCVALVSFVAFLRKIPYNYGYHSGSNRIV